MKPSLQVQTQGLRRDPAREQGSVRSLLLPVTCFALGLAVGMLWTLRGSRPGQTRQPVPELSDSTRAVLGGLNQPVEIHFYSLLDSSAPPTLGPFAQHVSQLLLAYQQQANGKIAVTRIDTQTNANPNAALADGIQGFALDKGEGCYLGIAFSSAGKKEVLPRLSPEWEPALEADVSRAIQHLTQTAPSAKAIPSAAPGDAATLGEIRQRIANIDSVSLEEGIRILREDAIKEFSTAAGEMQARVQEAQVRLVQARNSGSPAEQDAAMKNLQTVQAEQARRLKEIAANSEARLEAFKQLKSGAK